MIEFFNTSEFEESHQLSRPLLIIKYAILKCQDSLDDWVRFESEGYLDGNEAIVLSIKVDLPTRSPYGLLGWEKIAICCESGDYPILKAYSLRKNFPVFSHLNQTPKNKPKDLCLSDVQFMEYMYNNSLMDFVQRVKSWLDRAASGELHLDEQPREPFISNTAGDFVLDSDTYERIITGDSNIELFPTYVLKPNKFFRRFYIEASSIKNPNKNFKSPFTILCIKSKPTFDQCINYKPENYLDLYDLLLNKLSIYLSREIYSFLYNSRQLKKHDHLSRDLLLVLCIPRLNSKGLVTVPEIIVFHIKKKLYEIGLLHDCLVESYDKRKDRNSFDLKNTFKDKDKKFRKVKVDSFKVIRPFTKHLAAKMAGITKEIIDNSFAVIGQGALGSQLTLNLARQGFQKWRLIDQDTLLPHNFARHGVSAGYRGNSKAVATYNEIALILDKSDVIPFPAPVYGFSHRDVNKAFDTDIILDCSASHTVFLALAYRQKPDSRTFSCYYGGKGYTSVLICEDSQRKIRIDDIDLQLKIKGLKNRIIKNIYRKKEDNQIVYSTSCNETTTVMPQDLVAVHAGIISMQIKKALNDENSHVFVNNVKADGLGVDVETFIPAEMTLKDCNRWKFRISPAAIEEMSKFRGEKLPDETGGVLIGWINSFEQVVYIGKAIPAPLDSVERPYYFKRGKKGLHNLVHNISEITNKDLYYVGEWHSHPPNCSVSQSMDDKIAIKKISGMMLEDSLPGVMVTIADSNKIACYVECGWENA
jgi:tRNA A37 threonylcarbamoyladenosine dehydratase